MLIEWFTPVCSRGPLPNYSSTKHLTKSAHAYWCEHQGATYCKNSYNTNNAYHIAVSKRDWWFSLEHRQVGGHCWHSRGEFTMDVIVSSVTYNMPGGVWMLALCHKRIISMATPIFHSMSVRPRRLDASSPRFRYPITLFLGQSSFKIAWDADLE